MFIADGCGAMKHLIVDDTGNMKVAKFYEHASLWEIRKILITENNKYTFTLDTLGCLRQFLVKEKQLHYDWSNGLDTDEVGEFILTTDSKYIFTSDKSLCPDFLGGGLGNLKQHRIESKELVRDFGDITDSIGMPMGVTSNGKF